MDSFSENGMKYGEEYNKLRGLSLGILSSTERSAIQMQKFLYFCIFYGAGWDTFISMFSKDS